MTQVLQFNGSSDDPFDKERCWNMSKLLEKEKEKEEG